MGRAPEEAPWAAGKEAVEAEWLGWPGSSSSRWDDAPGPNDGPGVPLSKKGLTPGTVGGGVEQPREDGDGEGEDAAPDASWALRFATGGNTLGGGETAEGNVEEGKF